MAVRERDGAGVDLVLGGTRSCHGCNGGLWRGSGRGGRLEGCLESKEEEEVEQLRERRPVWTEKDKSMRNDKVKKVSMGCMDQIDITDNAYTVVQRVIIN